MNIIAFPKSLPYFADDKTAAPHERRTPIHFRQKIIVIIRVLI
jgi:hypothetical protein